MQLLLIQLHFTLRPFFFLFLEQAFCVGHLLLSLRSIQADSLRLQELHAVEPVHPGLRRKPQATCCSGSTSSDASDVEEEEPSASDNTSALLSSAGACAVKDEIEQQRQLVFDWENAHGRGTATTAAADAAGAPATEGGEELMDVEGGSGDEETEKEKNEDLRSLIQARKIALMTLERFILLVFRKRNITTAKSTK